MTDGVNIGLSGLKAAKNKLKNIGHNIANIETAGFKKEMLYTTQAMRGGARLESYTDVESKGSLVSTGINTDLSIENGHGMFAIADESGSMFYTPTGGFPINHESIMELERGGFSLQAWKYDTDGRLSTDLHKVSIPQEIAAQDTKAVNVNVKLASNIIPSGGGGSISLKNDIDVSKDGLSFLISHAGMMDGEIKKSSQKYTFGGFAVVDSSAAAADFATASVKIDDEASITVDLTDDAAIENAGLRLIKTDGTKKYIAPKDANSSITIDYSTTDAAAQTAAITAGVHNGEKRFATMEEFVIKADRHFDSILQPSSGEDTFVAFAKSDKSTYFHNLSSTDNILQAMGITSNNGYMIASDYDPFNPEKNIASGGAHADFTANFAVYDSTGNQHILHAGMRKLDSSRWICEIYSNNPSEINTTDGFGLLQVSEITFNDEGEVATVKDVQEPEYSIEYDSPTEIWSSPITLPDGAVVDSLASLTQHMNGTYNAEASIVQNSAGKYRIVVKNPSKQSLPSSIVDATISGRTKPSGNTPLTIDWTADGILNPSNSTISIDYKNIALSSAHHSSGNFESDGYHSGSIKAIEVANNGDIIATFTNKQRQNVAKIPVAVFANFNGLKQSDGSLFLETNDSGKAQFLEAGQGKAGTIVSSHLESSTVDLQEELPAMSAQQQVYQANAASLQKNMDMLSYLIRMINN